MSPMILAATVFALSYALVISERLDRTVAVVAGATAVIALGVVPYEYALQKIDLNVVFLLVGMMMVVSVLADTGLFEWVAVSIAQRARGNGLLILGGLLIATAVLSAFLDNVTTVVLVAPVTILIAQILEVRPLPFLVLEAIFSNLGGTATLIGDPPNILIGLRNDLNFNQFLFNLAPPVLVLGLVILAVVLLWFRRDVMPRREARLRIMQARPERAITDPVRLRRGLVVFAAIIAGFVLGHVLHIEPGLVGLAGGLTMVAVCRTDLQKTLERVEWTTIFFLIGLFMLVSSLEFTGLFQTLGAAVLELTGGRYLLLLLAILWISGVLAAVLGNIPVTVAMIPLVQSTLATLADTAGMQPLDPVFRLHVAAPLWWALALGACLGGNGTLFGAAANVVVAQIARRNGYRISFWRFATFGLPITLLSLALCSLYLALRYWVLSPLAH